MAQVTLNKWPRGDSRSARMGRNIIGSVAVKVGSILCSLVIVPLTIDFVNPVQYGIWLTISSVVAWMSFFDIGFCNGLRNKLAIAIAQSDRHRARIYVSTTYAVLTVIFGVLMAAMLALTRWAHLSALLHIDASYEADLKTACSILVVYFCVTFVLRILSNVLLADQRPALSAAIEFVGQALTLPAIWMFRHTVDGSLTWLALGLCVPPMVVWAVMSLVLYRRRYRYCRPRWGAVDLKESRSLFGMGAQFFVIQIAAIIQYQTANILIARIFSMEDVTAYNIAYKYFNVLNMGFMILLQPFWSAVTDAYARGELEWIRRQVRRYLALALAAVGAACVMLWLADWVYAVWLNSAVIVPTELSGWMAVYVLTTLVGSIFCYFVNGIGALRIQFAASIVSPLVFVALVWALCVWGHVGVWGILIASIVANFNGIILAPMQYVNIILKHKTGIWSK
jgi:O-antigen/teichoic acid export membrane protein